MSGVYFIGGLSTNRWFYFTGDRWFFAAAALLIFSLAFFALALALTSFLWFVRRVDLFDTAAVPSAACTRVLEAILDIVLDVVVDMF